MGRKRIIKLWLSAVFILVSLLVGSAAPSPVFGGEGRGQGRLDEWQVRARALFEVEGVVYTDASEQTGLLEVGVVNKGLARSVEVRLRKLGIPRSSVAIVETKPIVFATTLRDYVRPLDGGLQISFVDGGLGYLCTLGFNAVRDGVNGFVVNSHCTADQFGLDGTGHYQPSLSPSSNLIGSEIADPPSFRCARGRKCRYSDAAYDQRAVGVQATLGSIARPVSPGSLEIAGSFSIVGEAAGNAVIGTVLNKVGRTTGWTQGKVTHSCVDTGVSGTNILLLCQDFVAAEVGGGDSGSPVFEITDGTNVTLNGILWGGASDGSSFVYSPIGNVKGELGSLTTYVGGNIAPVADFSYTANDLMVSFADQSSDSDGSVVSWSWDLGDGSSSTVQDPSHTYAAGGTYAVSLTVTDDEGATDSVSKSVTVDSGGGGGTMHVSGITMSSKMAGRNAFVYTTVTIVDASGNPVSNATVNLTTTLPDGQTDSGAGITAGDGTVTFSLKSGQTGTFTSEVTNVTHASLTYDPDANAATSESIIVP